MGDRGTVIFKVDGEPDLLFYTHWRGSDLENIIRGALRRKVRWDDPPYLARIIFCEMIQGAENRETGFGISTRARDGREIVVDASARKVGSLTFDQFTAE